MGSKEMPITRFYLMLFLSLIFLFGCVRTNILDEVGLTSLIGYDIGQEEKIAVTGVIREINPDFKSKVQVITTENNTLSGNKIKTNRKLSEQVSFGQTRVITFGEDLAREGLDYFIHTNLENPDMNDNLYMAVIEGKVADLLEYKYKDIEDIGQHIFRLIEQNNKQKFITTTNLHIIADDYYSSGKEMAMPILKRDGDLVEFSAIAIFKGGKMVSTLQPKDNFFVNVIRENFNMGVYETVLQGDGNLNNRNSSLNEMRLTFDTIKSKRKIKLVDASKPEFDLNISMKSRVLEVSPDINFWKQESVAALEKDIEKRLKNEISRVIGQTQEVESDIFGFGEKYRSTVRHSKLTKEKWQKKYKNMKVNVNIDFTILRNGVFE